MLPPIGGRFEAAALDLQREAAALAAGVHPLTLAALARLVRVVNAYYSNLIEGVRTTPAEIEAAMRADYAHDPGRAALQRLAAGHVRAEAAIAGMLAANPDAAVTTPAFLLDLHRRLYEDVPAPERTVRSPSGRTLVVVPGAPRTERVTVGRHLAPPPEAIASLLERFHEAYRPEVLSPVTRVVGFAASHHRLAWIHPFLDGNGRVTRLASVAYARRIGLDAAGLWSIARGFARHRAEYYAALAEADAPRRSHLDGRGALSLAGLDAWCHFVVRVALDQIGYMRATLRPDTLADRLRGYVALRAATRPRGAPPSATRDAAAWRPEAGDLLAALVLRGEIPRGEALRHLPGKERTARAALSALLRDGILESASHRAPVHLAFPAHVVAIVFPELTSEPSSAPPLAAPGSAGA